MSIQSSINQTLSIASVLGSVNPVLKKKAELRSLNKQKANLIKARDTAGYQNAELALDYQSDIADVSKQLFEIDPSDKTLAEYKKEYGATEEASMKRATVVEADPEEIAAERWEKEQKENEINWYLDQYRQASKSAQQSLEVKQNEKRSTRRNFLDYLKEEPTSLGLSVGQLGKSAQKYIAGQYDKKERKEIMDRKDEK